MYTIECDCCGEVIYGQQKVWKLQDDTIICIDCFRELNDEDKSGAARLTVEQAAKELE
jgi:formylmethanofuran dehydrogenase subunit E